MTSFIRINWLGLHPKTDARWNSCRVLYAYIAPDHREVLYIGKAYGCSVRERWRRSGKSAFWDDLEREREIKGHAVIVGDISETSFGRITEEIITDVEALLINRLQPWGNIQSRTSRGVTRPGLHVFCEGEDWPHLRKKFIDR